MKETMKKRRALLVCLPLLVSACGSGDGNAAEAQATETSEAAAAAAANEAANGSGNGLGSSVDGEGGGDAAGGAADDDATASNDSLVGRTGPIREMPIFADRADQDLRTFLNEVMHFQDQFPVPEDAVLTYVSHDQFFRQDGGSSVSFTARYQPMFDRDWFRDSFATLVDGNIWQVSEVDEDLERNETRLEFSSLDEEAEFKTFWAVYADGDAQKQPKLSWGTSGSFVPTRDDIVVNEVLFPWMDEITIPEAAWKGSVTVNIGRLPGKVELDRRWDAPASDFEATHNFFAAGGSPGFTVGEVEYSDSPWPKYKIPVVAEDRDFEGRFSVSQSDPEKDTYISLIGWLAESQ